MRCSQLLVTFIIALILNFIWEELHSALYISYQGGAITTFILFRAALFDAAVITLFAYVFLSPFPPARGGVDTPADGVVGARGRMKVGVFVIALLALAVLLEKWALGTGRWVYADAMPIIPILHVGLTPAIQLGLTGFLALWLANRNWLNPR
jgi:hypothetical protein